MKILFLTHYFPPEVNAPANRTHEHARRWVEDGHEVTIITGVPNHPRGELFPGYRNRWLQEEQIDGIRVLRTWMYLASNQGFARRILNYLLFAVAATLASVRAERPDVVVSTSPQFFCGLAGVAVSWLKWRPFVLEVRDLWPDSIVQLGQLQSRSLIGLLEALETGLYRSAAGIVVNSRAFIQHIADRGIPRERIELVYNGIDPELFRPRPPNEALLREQGLEGRSVVSYIGTLGLAHGLMTIVEAAERLRGDPTLAFALIGEGADRGRIEDEVAARGLDNVFLAGLRPRAEIPDWIGSSAIPHRLARLRDGDPLEVVRVLGPGNRDRVGRTRGRVPPPGRTGELGLDDRARRPRGARGRNPRDPRQSRGREGTRAQRPRTGGSFVPERRPRAADDRLPRALHCGPVNAPAGSRPCDGHTLRPYAARAHHGSEAPSGPADRGRELVKPSRNR